MANSLQAVLDNQKTKEAPKLNQRQKQARPTSEARRSRQGTRLIGGHFSPDVARQIRILAAEEDMTVQALLEEALSDLFVKKGKKAII
jgi:hypothetical protein